MLTSTDEEESLTASLSPSPSSPSPSHSSTSSTKVPPSPSYYLHTHSPSPSHSFSPSDSSPSHTLSSSLSSSPSLSRTLSTEPLRKEDVTKHFPSDFDCSQLLFSNERIMWVQHVPRLKRYVPSQLLLVLLKHAIVLGFSIVLFSIGNNLENAEIDEIIRSVRSEYITSGFIFFTLFVFMVFKDFGGYAVDIATNVRMVHAFIYPTLVCCETISYKSVERVTTSSSHLRFTLRVLNKSSSFFASLRRGFSSPKFYFSYIPDDNAGIKDIITTLFSEALREAAALERSEDAIQKLEDNTPSRDTGVFEKYNANVGDTDDNILWGYTPTSFEKKRSTIIQLSMVAIYYVIVTIGLVLPVVSVLYKSFTYAGVGNFVLIVWHLYFIAVIIMDTEFNEIITLNESSIASFTTRLTLIGRCPRFVQCGSRVTKLSYANAYPLYTYLYRTPNTTPTEYTKLRKLQGLEARILGYTDGSGAVQFPNNLTLRVPNMLDVESAILQKHYQMWRDAQASLPNRSASLQQSTMASLQPPLVEADAFQIDDDAV